MAPWPVEAVHGTVAWLHDPQRQAAAPGGRRGVELMRPDDSALVLGSGQRLEGLALDRLAGRGLTWCRRRSGGGAVVVERGQSCWIDLVIGRNDPLWVDAVDVAMEWVGEAWADALGSLGVRGEVHRVEPLRRDAGRIACFAGVGRGEVLVDGAKAVGISQRRDRRGARFQCVVHGRFDLAVLTDVVIDPSDRALVEESTRVYTHDDPAALEQAFVSALRAY